MTPHHGSTPHQDSFYLPADSARLGRVWLAWPEAQPLQDTVARLVGIMAEFAQVTVVAAPARERAARAAVGSKVEIVALPCHTARLRDIGPALLIDGKGGAAAVDWRFNAWGGRQALDQTDRDFAHALLGHAEVRRFRAPLTLESSAFTGDGQDTVLALAPAVFDPARNPDLSRLEAFAIFQQWLGAGRVVWIEQAHPADTLACDVRAVAAFAGVGRILVSRAADSQPHAEVLAAIIRDLARVRDGQGNHFEIIPLPAPPATAAASAAAPMSYTGFLPVNGAILMPAYGIPSDDEARDILSEIFPQQPVHAVPAAALAAAGVSLTSLVVPHPARLLERDRASLLPRSAWSQPAPDVDAVLQKYIDLAEEDAS